MKRWLLMMGFLVATGVAYSAQHPFQAVSTLNASTIQGRPVQLDEHGNLLPWPRPHHTGYSYEAYFMSRWKYLWEQYNHQRHYDFYCCVNYDRQTFATFPDRHWANSTGYLRAMEEGFIEHLYPYTGDPRTLQFLEDFVDYTVTIPAGQLRRVRTGWTQRTFRVSFETEGKATLGSLRFDNLAYNNSAPMPPGIKDATRP